MHELQREEAKTWASLCISVLGGGRPLVPCSPKFSVLSRSVAGDARGEAEDGLHAGGVGLCSVSIRNALDGTKHVGKLGHEPGMPVCGAGHPMLLGCCRSWGTMFPLPSPPPRLLPPRSGWIKHLRGFGSWVVSKPSSELPNQQVSRYTTGLLMPRRSED